MSTIPEGASTVAGEGNDLRAAVMAAAEALGVEPARVGYKLDLSHFRNATGGSVARHTVKVVAWEKPEGEADTPVATPAPKPKARKPRANKDEAPPEVAVADAEGDLSETPAAVFAQGWMASLVEHMGLTGTVSAKGNDERVVLDIDVDKAGRLIGRRGVTLSAIRHILRLALEVGDFGTFTIDVEIPDSRDGGSKPKSERGERGDRDDGGRRGRRRGRDRGDRGDRGEPKGEYDEDKLRTIAERAAAKALETGRPITIKVKLNSYDRRIVHLAAGDVDGVATESVVKDGVKYVQVLPEDAD